MRRQAWGRDFAPTVLYVYWLHDGKVVETKASSWPEANRLASNTDGQVTKTQRVPAALVEQQPVKSILLTQPKRVPVHSPEPF